MLECCVGLDADKRPMQSDWVAVPSAPCFLVQANMPDNLQILVKDWFASPIFPHHFLWYLAAWLLCFSREAEKTKISKVVRESLGMRQCC